MSNQRLNDPKNIAGDKHKALQDKLLLAQAKLARSPDKGGIPFVYSFAAVKVHELDDMTLPILDEKGEKVKQLKTAATDGNKYKWSPDFLEKLTTDETALVMAHETYHIVMQHCNINRVQSRNRMLWNLAIDYIVNNSIEHDKRYANVISAYIADHAYSQNDWDKTPHPMWNGNFGHPKIMKDLLKDIEKMVKEYAGNGNKPKKPDPNEAEPPPVIFVDYSLWGKSAEEIYNMLQQKMDEEKEKNGISAVDGMSDQEMKEMMEAYGVGETLDAHEAADVDRHKLLEDILNAMESTKKLAGSVPGSLEEFLKELMEPKLRWQDLVKHAIQKKRQEKGAYNDWTRFRRRPLSLKMWRPKKKDDTITWVCMLDTSGSMTNDDIAYGISQLKVLDGKSRGYVVPCDTECYWDKMKEIRSMNDLPKVNVVGRGGTVFNRFFSEWKKRIRDPVDLIIVITDGYFSVDFPKPTTDVVWVITNDHDPKLPWGRTAPLRSF
ncbi:MAG: VWA-like domain-containing protein [bacterium]|nr:VWA-like domain-containing protein [bacterium]